GPRDHHLHAVDYGPDQERRHQSCAYGRRHYHDIGFWIDHTALRALLVDGREIRRHQILARHGGVAADLYRILCRDRVYDFFPRRGAVAAEAAVAAVGRLFPESERIRIHLSLDSA